MFVRYVTRGVKAGLVAGLAFGLFVALVANPLVGFADGLGHDHQAAGDHHGESGGGGGAVVSAAVTRAVSVVSGVLWGVLLGGVVFGVAYYFLEPALPGRGGTKSYVLAVAGFVTVSGAPWLVFPPRPPGVEQALPTRTRVLLYGGMMVAGALVCLLAGFAYGRFRDSYGRVTAASLAVLPFGLLAIPVALAPANTVESGIPAGLATGLTGMIVFGQILVWGLLAGAHARFQGRSGDGPDLDVEPSRSGGTAPGD